MAEQQKSHFRKTKVQQINEIEQNGLSPRMQKGIRDQIHQSSKRLPFIDNMNDLNKTLRDIQSIKIGGDEIDGSNGDTRYSSIGFKNRRFNSMSNSGANHLMTSTGMGSKSISKPFNMNFNDRKHIDGAMLRTNYEDKNLQSASNMGLSQLLKNHHNHEKITTNQREYDENLNMDINIYRPNEYYVSPKPRKRLNFLESTLSSIKEKSGFPLDQTFYSTTGGHKNMDNNKIQQLAEQKLQQKLKKMSAAYHHHFHNAIVGMEDADRAYNAKWLDKSHIQKNYFLNDDRSTLQNDIGSVRPGDFRRGQGGLFSHLPHPFDASNAAQMYLESEKRNQLVDIGINLGSQQEFKTMMQEDDKSSRPSSLRTDFSRYKKDGSIRRIKSKFQTPMSKKNSQFTLEDQRCAQQNTSRQLLGSLNRTLDPQISNYINKQQLLSKRDMSPHDNQYFAQNQYGPDLERFKRTQLFKDRQQRPTAINLFPTQNQESNFAQGTRRYITQNMRNQNPLREHPLGDEGDSFPHDQGHVKWDGKAYMNSMVESQGVLVQRKRPALKKQK